MKRLALLVVLVACDAGAKKSPPPVVGSAAVAPADASAAVVIDAPPPPKACSREDLHAAGEQLLPRVASFDGCEPRWERIEDIEMARAKGHVINAKMVRAIETKNAAELDRLVACPHPMKIDWKHDHAWVITMHADEPRVVLQSTFDDGHTFLLGVHAYRKECGGAAPRTYDAFTVAVVRSDRDVAMGECWDPPKQCSGFEK